MVHSQRRRAIAALAVIAYAIALLVAKRAHAAGRTTTAAQLTGGALLVMVAIGVVGIPFQLPVLILMPIAAVSVVLPHLRGHRLKRFMVASFVVTAWVVAMTCVVPPFFEQPPSWFQHATLAGAILAASALTLRLLWMDAERLNESLTPAEEAIAVRDDFLLVASHEINTPLTPLNLKLEMLWREATQSEDTPFRARVLAHVEASRRQVRRLGGLVNDLLDGSRLRAGRLTLELTNVDLCALVNEVTSRFEAQATQLGSRLERQLPVETVMGRWDRQRLEQVVSNLLSNALKFGSGTPVSISLARGATQAVLQVRDEGIGVPAEAAGRIFDKFARAVSERN